MQRHEGEFLLARLPEEDARAIRDAGTLVEFDAGEELLAPGTDARSLVIAESGYLKVCREHGEREVVLSVHGPGELLGEIALLDRGDHAASVVALTHGLALHLDTAAFWRILGERPHLNRSIIATVTTRLRDASQQRAEHLAAPAVLRVSGRILSLADRYGSALEDEVTVRMPLTQAELSSWAGVSRETGVRALRQLRDAGWVRLEHRRIVVTDLAALRRFTSVEAHV